jgi:2-keto-4-pentenoate hydratase/2-oxohepta-3-ene-1,7-dioic acid hydratase in catechol pathway
VLIAKASVGGRPRHGKVGGEGSARWFQPVSGDVFGQFKDTGSALALASLRLLPPVVPRQMWAVLGGFVGQGPPPRATPRLAPKVVTRLRTEGAIVRPIAGEESVTCEVELALVVGRAIGPGAMSDEVKAAIGGYTIVDDVTSPGLLALGDVSLAKSADGFAVVGALIRTDVTEDEIAEGLTLTCRVNGEQRQHGTTADYRFAPWQVLAHLASYVSLRRQDMITLGTPIPPALARPGDLVELEVSGLGVLRHRVGGCAKGDPQG